MRISARAQRIEPFYVMEMAKSAAAIAREAAGSDRPMIYLNIGEPDFTAPPLVAEAYDVGRANKLDPTLILAVMAIESSFNPFAQSPVGAQGLMQVMTQIHSDKYEHFGGQYAAFDPKSNLRVGVKVLSEYVTRTGSVEGGLKWYVGAANMASDGGYADKVMAEHSRLSQVAKGKTIPLTDNTPALRAATTPAPSAPASNAPVKVAALS